MLSKESSRLSIRAWFSLKGVVLAVKSALNPTKRKEKTTQTAIIVIKVVCKSINPPVARLLRGRRRKTLYHAFSGKSKPFSGFIVSFIATKSAGGGLFLRADQDGGGGDEGFAGGSGGSCGGQRFFDMGSDRDRGECGGDVSSGGRSAAKALLSVQQRSRRKRLFFKPEPGSFLQYAGLRACFSLQTPFLLCGVMP